MQEATPEQLQLQVAELNCYRALFDLNDDGVCVLERLPRRQDGLRDYRYVAMNRAVQDMFHVGDLSGQSVRDNFPDEVEDWYDDFDRVLDSGHSIRFERETVPQAMVLDMFLARVGDGAQGRLLVVMRNVTARVRAERMLHDRESQLSVVFNNSVDGINLLDLKTGRYVVLNVAQASMTGFTMEELNGISAEEAAERVHPDDREISLEQQRRIATGEADTITAEYRWKVKSGEYRWFSDQRKLVRDAEGRPVALVGTSRDITSRKKTEEELVAARLSAELSESADRSKTHFLAAASHDLRQPIQAITLLIEALGNSGLDARQDDVVSRIGRLTKALGDMLDQLLDISRLDAGQIQAEPAELSANQLVMTLHDEFLPIAAEKKLNLGLFVSRRCGLIRADPQLLLHVLRNLLGNALKFTQRGGVLVSVRPRGNHALFQVWDTGIGIPRDKLEAIFEEYVQLGNASSDRTQGIGLGLAIVRRLAEVLSINVECRSRVGLGSVFSLSLPTVPAMTEPPAAQPEPAVAQPHTLAQHKRLVIVDDDWDVALSLKLAFESHGLAVSAFGSAEEALASSDTAQADYVVTDYRLPGMGGLEFLQALRGKSGASASLPSAVMITGETSPDRLKQASTLGWPILRKPVRVVDVLAALNR